jgi:hypothetical protein
LSRITLSTVSAKARLLNRRMVPMPVALMSCRSCSTLAGVMTSLPMSASLRDVR